MKQAEDYLKNYAFLLNSCVSAENDLFGIIEKKNEYISSLLKSSFPTGIKVQSGATSDMVTSAIAEISELYDRKIRGINKSIHDLNSKIYDINRFFDRCMLSEHERKYINLRYLKCETNSNIAYSLHICERAVYNLRKSLLTKIKNNMAKK